MEAAKEQHERLVGMARWWLRKKSSPNNNYHAFYSKIWSHILEMAYINVNARLNWSTYDTEDWCTSGWDWIKLFNSPKRQQCSSLQQCAINFVGANWQWTCPDHLSSETNTGLFSEEDKMFASLAISWCALINTQITLLLRKTGNCFTWTPVKRSKQKHILKENQPKNWTTLTDLLLPFICRVSHSEIWPLLPSKSSQAGMLAALWERTSRHSRVFAKC